MPRKRKPINYLSDVVVSDKPSDRQDFSTRKIDNGYIVRTSGVKNGKWFESERFTPKAPKIVIEKPTRTSK